MKKLALIVLILLIAAAAYYLLRKNGGPAGPSTIPVAINETEKNLEKQEPEIRHPVPEPDLQSIEASGTLRSMPLPALDNSGSHVRDDIAEIYDSRQLDRLFIFDSIIRYFVVTIDNMTSPKLPRKFKFTRLPEGNFSVQEKEQEIFNIDPANYDRYTPYVEFVDSINLDRMVNLYFHYYPLFQQAYAELGYPDRYFNDRFVEVIDHLLETPDIQGPVQLKRPKVYYIFADPELEALSSGQKILIRIGHENAVKVKNVLRELREHLINVRSEEN